VISIGLSTDIKEALNYDIEQKIFKGILSEKYQCVIDKINTKYSIELYPVARLFHRLKLGKVDIALPSSQVKSRDKFAHYTNNLFTLEHDIFYHQSLGKLTLSELKSRTNEINFVTKRATYATKTVQHIFNPFNNGKLLKIHEVNDWNTSLKFVAMKRAQVTIIPKMVYQQLNKKIISELFKIPLEPFKISMYISKQSKNHQQLLKNINTAIKHCLE
jgi:ABC-type amino acid transport substrate-binding protein